MKNAYEKALTKLQQKLKFEAAPVHPVDYFYTDGSAVGSLFKLIFSEKSILTSVVYIFPGRWWVSYGALTDEQSLAIHDWIDEVELQRG
jgi:hypothetical protein